MQPFYSLRIQPVPVDKVQALKQWLEQPEAETLTKLIVARGLKMQSKLIEVIEQPVEVTHALVREVESLEYALALLRCIHSDSDPIEHDSPYPYEDITPMPFALTPPPNDNEQES